MSPLMAPTQYGSGPRLRFRSHTPTLSLPSLASLPGASLVSHALPPSPPTRAANAARAAQAAGPGASPTLVVPASASAAVSAASASHEIGFMYDAARVRAEANRELQKCLKKHRALFECRKRVAPRDDER